MHSDLCNYTARLPAKNPILVCEELFSKEAQGPANFFQCLLFFQKVNTGSLKDLAFPCL